MGELKLYAGIALVLVLIGALVGGGWWAYEKGKDAQAATDQKAMTDLSTERDNAIRQSAADAAAMKACSDATTAAQAAAANQRKQADQQVAAAAQAVAASAKASANWQAKYQAALKTPACKGAEEELCPALSDY